jgi:serine/threonine protein kinase
MAPRRDYPPGALIQGTVYQVIRTIGAGGMGTVYDVEDTTIGKRYVMKTLHPDLGDRQDLARRMQNEARTLARLNHPNIVEVVTAGVTGDELRLPFYVMERLNGQNLRIVLQKKGRLELPHAYHIAIDLLDALDHAHDKGVIHRDVKPDNIFLHRTSAGVTVTKLLDFGIMGLLEQGRSGAETGGRFLGTLRYASPEQLRGGVKTPKMDLYAAALVLYEMIAGRGPFDDEPDAKAVASAHLARDAPPIAKFVRVPAVLDTLLASALSKDAAVRPRDAFTFASELRNLKRSLSGEPGEDSTENRSTVAAVITHATDGGIGGANIPILVKDGPPPVPLSPLAESQTPATIPRTTLKGMTPPTMSGATLENAPPSQAPQAGTVTARISTSAPPRPQLELVALTQPPDTTGVDRNAPTHSIAVDTPRLPTDGTEAMGPAPAAPPIPEIQWPPEKPHDRSESGQVRSVAMGTSHGPSRQPSVFHAALSVAAAALLCGVAFAAWRYVASRPNANSAGSASTQTTPAPVDVPSVTASALSLPPVDEPSATAPAASAPSATATATTTTGTTTATKSRQRLPPSPPTTAQPTPPPHNDRPGPGF